VAVGRRPPTVRPSLILIASLVLATSALGSVSAPAFAPVAGASQEIEVVEIDAVVRLAPVVGAPAAGTVQRGDRLTSEAEVNGEAIDGNARWHLVTLSTEPHLVRGFIHSGLVRIEAGGE
jgi:hypothetical protein